jgi:hypothetical protein
MVVWAAVGLAIFVAVGRGVSRLDNQAFAREPAIAAEIGALVNHSTRTIFLSGDYGVPLEYHGLLSGAAWPIASDLEWEQLAGHPPMSAQERFQAWFAKDSPEYFIVIGPSELDEQPDLKQFLMTNFVLVTKDPDYLLFDLQRSSPG